MKEIVLITGLANKDPECWKVFKESGLYRETINSAIDALRAEFDLVGTDMDIDQTKREELFKEFYKQLKLENSLKSYLADKERIAFLAWLRTKAINLLYDKIVSVSKEQIVKNLIDRKRITTDIVFHGNITDLSFMPSIISYLDKCNLLGTIQPEDFSSAVYKVFMDKIHKFRQECSLITFLYTQRILTEALDDFLGTDRHKDKEFKGVSELPIEDMRESKALLRNNAIFSTFLDESNDYSIDIDYYKRTLDLIYQKMINDGYEQYVKELKLLFSVTPPMKYQEMASILNMPENTIKTHISRGKKIFISILNNYPKEMRKDIVKQINN